MNIPIFQAISSAQWQRYASQAPHPAYMSVGFSPSDTGLTNLPPRLPDGCMVILDDSIPPTFHQPETVAAQLAALGCGLVLLDWERPPTEDANGMLDAICKVCSPIVPPAYGREGLPVFLPPVPLHQKPSDCFSHYAGTEIWLEVCRQSKAYVITEKGCTVEEAQSKDGLTLHAAYQCRMEVTHEPGKTVYHLQRGKEEWENIFKDAPVAGGVCLCSDYRQLFL